MGNFNKKVQKNMANITKDTKIKELLRDYPWLIDEAVKIESDFKILKTPVGKLFLRNATIGDLCQRAGLSEGEIIGNVNRMIAEYA